MFKRIIFFLFGIFISAQALATIDPNDYRVSREVEELLDAHLPELEKMLDDCLGTIHCKTKMGTKRFDWLKGFIVKRGVGRISWANKSRNFIEQHNLHRLYVPNKYLYHIKTRPIDLNDDNYVVLSQEIIPQAGGRVDLEAMKQLYFYMTGILAKDLHAKNIIVDEKGNVAIIDTGAETFFPTKNPRLDRKFFSFAKLVNERGKFHIKNKISKEAYDYVIHKLAKFIRKVPGEKSWYYSFMKQHARYVKSINPPQFDYMEALKDTGLA